MKNLTQRDRHSITIATEKLLLLTDVLLRAFQNYCYWLRNSLLISSGGKGEAEGYIVALLHGGYYPSQSDWYRCINRPYWNISMLRDTHIKEQPVSCIQDKRNGSVSRNSSLSPNFYSIAGHTPRTTYYTAKHIDERDHQNRMDFVQLKSKGLYSGGDICFNQTDNTFEWQSRCKNCFIFSESSICPSVQYKLASYMSLLQCVYYMLLWKWWVKRMMIPVMSLRTHLSLHTYM